MKSQDIQYLLHCIKKDNHAIVCAYLRRALEENEGNYWTSLKQLIRKDRDLVTRYLSDTETLDYFEKYSLPAPEKHIIH